MKGNRQHESDLLTDSAVCTFPLNRTIPSLTLNKFTISTGLNNTLINTWNLMLWSRFKVTTIQMMFHSDQCWCKKVQFYYVYIEILIGPHLPSDLDVDIIKLKLLLIFWIEALLLDEVFPHSQECSCVNNNKRRIYGCLESYVRY